MASSDSYTLFANDHVVLLQPSAPAQPVLRISRPEGALALLPSTDFVPSAFGPFDRSFRCYGIYGMIELLAGRYLVVIRTRSLIGTLPGSDSDVRQVVDMEIVSCGRSLAELSSQQRADEGEFLRLLREAFHYAPFASGLYYCHGQPLTCSLQAQFAEPHDPAVWKLSRDDPFCVNRPHLAPFIGHAKRHPSSAAALASFICICIQGFVEIRELLVGESRITFALISRRDTGRTGARYHSRGIDSHGKVSNFVETEQLVFTSDGRCGAFLQTRGSIPLFWRQNVCIRYKPELEICDGKELETQRAFRLHRDAMIARYGAVLAVNLVELKGGEGRLAQRFSSLSSLDVSATDKWKYVEFDFHHHCRNMAYHNVNNLVERLHRDLEAAGFFEGRMADRSVQKRQCGVVRTNCMDCLDRTNVVQSALAKRVLERQLRDLGVMDRQRGSVDAEPVLGGVFKNVWADNADAISTQYSGTGALKTDFTRTGKRTFMGAVQDGTNSMLRYCYGNFSDGNRQDALDLLFGSFRPAGQPTYASPWIRGHVDQLRVGILWTLSCSIVLFFLLAHMHSLTGTWRWWRRVAMVLCVLVVGMLLQYIRAHGKRFVQYPRLIPPPAALLHHQHQQHVSVKNRDSVAQPLLHNKHS